MTLKIEDIKIGMIFRLKVGSEIMLCEVKSKSEYGDMIMKVLNSSKNDLSDYSLNISQLNREIIK
jgi:hypothetical protein